MEVRLSPGEALGAGLIIVSAGFIRAVQRAAYSGLCSLIYVNTRMGREVFYREISDQPQHTHTHNLFNMCA